MIFPPPLKEGDRVGVIAISGPVEEDLLERGVRELSSRGLIPILGDNVLKRNDYLAGTDKERLSDFVTMCEREDIRAVYFARGGYGCMRILDGIPLDILRKRPKMLIGMSDLTALQLFLYANSGLVSLAGPTLADQLAKGLDSSSSEQLFRLMFNIGEACPLFQPEDLNQAVTRRRGIAEGPLLGGCLSMLTSMIGTGLIPSLDSAILILEDINEPLYRIDRMFMQLKLAGILDRVSGIILGHFIDPEGNPLDEEVARIALELTALSGIPIIGNFPHGHALPNLTIPIGAGIRFDTSSMLFELSS
jgi:muramoyltetrapeptide carboxypeptidase